MYDELIINLDSTLNEFGTEVDERLNSMSNEEIMESINISENNLEQEYQKIAQIKANSLNAGMFEQVSYI